MRRSAGSVLVMPVVLATLVAPAGSALGQDTTPGLARLVKDPEVREVLIRSDIRFRKDLHFDASREHVEWLYDHLDRTEGERGEGLLLTPDERDEFVARDRLYDDVSVVVEYYEDHPRQQDSFGGVMIDHAAGGVVAVYLVGDPPTPWLDEVPHRGRVVLRPAEMSYADLLDQKQALQAAIIEESSPVTDSVNALGVDVEHNAVRVYFSGDDLEALDEGALPPAFARRFGTDHLRAAKGGRLALDSSETNLKAGWSWDDVSNSHKFCMLGFAVEDPDHPSWDAMLTAGHCVLQRSMSNYDTVYHNYGQYSGADIGNVRPGALQNASTGVDGAWFRIFNVNGNGATFNATAQVVHGSGGTPYVLDVEGKVTDGQATGSNRCHTGRGDPHDSSTNCGVITDPDYNARLGSSYWVDHLVKFDADAGAGDSGGPVYRRNTTTNLVRAAGIDVGHAPWSATVTHGTATVYSRIQPILDEFGLNIKIASGQTTCNPITTCPEDIDDGDYPE